MAEVKVNIILYLMKDSANNKTSAVCDDPNHPVVVSGLVDGEGNDVTFDGANSGIAKWCEDNSIEFKVIEKENDFDLLWVADIPKTN